MKKNHLSSILEAANRIQQRTRCTWNEAVRQASREAQLAAEQAAAEEEAEPVEVPKSILPPEPHPDPLIARIDALPKEQRVKVLSRYCARCGAILPRVDQLCGCWTEMEVAPGVRR